MLWITLCLVPTLVAAEDQLSAVEQQRRQLTSVDIQPPAHVIYGLLVEPWLNSSSRHARRLPEQPPPADDEAALADRRQALVAVAVVSAALERADTDAADRLRRVLAEYDSAPADQQHSLLNSSLAELAEHLHAPVIRLEALLIAQQAQLEAVAGAVAALPDSSDAHDAITRFVNSVTATVGQRVSEAEVTINRLSDSLRQLNESIASDRPTKPDRSEKEADPVPAPPGRCCDQLEERLARLEAAAADRDQLAERLDAALARLRDLEERQMLLPRPSPAVQGGWRPAGSVEKEQDLSTAGSERLDTLVVGRSASTGEQDIITADSLVTADDIGAQPVAQSRQGRIGPDLGTDGYVRGSGRPFQCQPTALYVRLPGMYEWCQFNCPIYCPPSHCRCQGFRG
ncbi:hypothetical protein FJT64_006871 [Amphibalanus amphitrite]|uniref:Uncharacterized protein n=1 Tax=Amphibalanus amphitrite TaxID=1232801 RepID=A0A6A4W1I6_AMPAM|nr:hypothetical protein FJT64_006871 [Amphibalanus amphitrite]